MPMSLPMGAVDKSPDLSPWAGKGGQTWGAQPCLSPPTSVACISFLVSSPSWSHAWPLIFPIFPGRRVSLTYPPPQLILHACRSTSLLTLSRFPLKLRVAKTRVKAPAPISCLSPSLPDPSPCHVLPFPSSQPRPPHPPVRLLKRRSPPFCLDPAGARSLGVGPERSVPDSPSGLSLVSLLRAPTQAAARGTPPSTTCARAPCCAGLAGSPQTRRLPAAREPRWADPSPLAPPPPASQSLAATEVWGAVGVAASGTAWSPAPTSWATPDPEPR